MAFASTLIVKFEHTVQLHIVVRIAKAAVTVTVPQNTVARIAQHKRNAHLGVILEEVLVLSAHVQFLRLMLAETIESLWLVLELQSP